MNRVQALFDRMQAIEAEHKEELDVINERYRVDEVTWIGITAVWTVLLAMLNAEETEMVVRLLEMGLDEFNKQPLSIRVGFITLPKQLYETLRGQRSDGTHERPALPEDGPAGHYADESE